MSPRLDAADVGPPSLPWRVTLSVSMGLHVLGFGLAVGLPRLMPKPASRPVYIVDLVALPGGPANNSAPPPAAAAAQPAAPAAPKKSEKSVKLPEPRKPKVEPKAEPKIEPKKTPVVKKTPEPKPASKPAETAADTASTAKSGTAASPSQAPVTGKPSAATQDAGVPGGTGVAGGGFGGTGTAAADARTFYYSLVSRNIENAWKKPIYPPTESGRRLFTTQIRLTLTSSGRVSDVKVLTPSGYEAMDRSVLAAVNEAIIPPFPSALGVPSLQIQIEMVLTPD